MELLIIWLIVPLLFPKKDYFGNNLFCIPNSAEKKSILLIPLKPY